jgi:hypothetical protein
MHDKGPPDELLNGGGGDFFSKKDSPLCLIQPVEIMSNISI